MSLIFLNLFYSITELKIQIFHIYSLNIVGHLSTKGAVSSGVYVFWGGEGEWKNRGICIKEGWLTIVVVYSGAKANIPPFPKTLFSANRITLISNPSFYGSWLKWIVN